jgi:hypothetical protein
MHANIKLEAQKLVSDGITVDIYNQIPDTHGKLWVI